MKKILKRFSCQPRMMIVTRIRSFEKKKKNFNDFWIRFSFFFPPFFCGLLSTALLRGYIRLIENTIKCNHKTEILLFAAPHKLVRKIGLFFIREIHVFSLYITKNCWKINFISIGIVFFTLSFHFFRRLWSKEEKLQIRAPVSVR